MNERDPEDTLEYISNWYDANNINSNSLKAILDLIIDKPVEFYTKICDNLTIEEKIVKLIRKSNLRGGTDNVSIAYLERESGENK